VVPEVEDQVDTKRSGSEGILNWYEERYGDFSREGLGVVHR